MALIAVMFVSGMQECRFAVRRRNGICELLWRSKTGYGRRVISSEIASALEQSAGIHVDPAGASRRPRADGRVSAAPSADAIRRRRSLP